MGKVQTLHFHFTFKVVHATSGPPWVRMSTTAPGAFPMTPGCPGLMKGMKGRARQGLNDELRPRAWPVWCAPGAVPGAC